MSEQTTPRGTGIGPGAVIAGYRIEEPIGQGGMAVVYRAADDRLRRRVALKVLTPALASDLAFRTRFIRESRAAAAVDHPNVIPVYDAGDADGLLFLAMRYVQGGDVHSLLSQDHWLPATRAWAIISQVAGALDAAHAHSLIHRDVKPANMLLDGTGMNPAGPPGTWSDHVYLADFGISKQAFASRLTSTGQIVGTLDYIAPEQIEAAAVDGRADQYSLACVAFELLSGRPPFRAETSIALIQAHLAAPIPSLSQLRPEIPAAVDQVLTRAMAKSPLHRYPACAHFAADLGRALGLLAAEPELRHDQPEHHPAQSVPWSWPTPAAFASDQLSRSQWPAQPPAHLPAAAARPGGEPTPGPGPARQSYASAMAGPGQPPLGSGGPGQSQNTTIAGLVVAGAAMAAGVCALIFAALTASASGPAAPGSAQSAAPANATSPASSAATRQAAAVAKVLGTSRRTHGSLSGAVYNIESSCARLSPGQLSLDIREIRDAQAQRLAEYRAAGKLTTSALPDGTRLKSDLVSALEHSRRADGDFLAWALQEQSGCRPQKGSAAYRAAARQSGAASRFKIAFAGIWNTIGPRYGQRKVAPSDI